MFFTKVLVTGLISVSLCMANISGKVTDTSGVTPVAAATVQLERGGHSAVTKADGSFTLVTGTTGSLPQNGTLPPSCPPVRISGNWLTLTSTKESIVVIAAFDCSGKSVFSVRRTLQAGSQRIALPKPGQGIYLYKVKTGEGEFLLKGNSIDGISFGMPAIVKGSSLNARLSQGKSASVINDVIAVKKTGYLNYRCGIKNADTSGVVIRIIASAGNARDQDGNVYPAVKIGNQIWTVENLRANRYDDGFIIPFDTSKATWSNAVTPKYCYYNNTTNADSIKKYGALYNWHVINPANAHKIAPRGWHVPSNAEWDTLYNFLIAHGYNWDGSDTGNKISKSMAARTDWPINAITGTIGCDLAKNNSSGFSALPDGYRDYYGGFKYQGTTGYWWSTTEYFPGTYGWQWSMYSGTATFFKYSYSMSAGCAVRLVKD